ncbi:MAG: asparagine synthetase B, partial [Bacteroidota bacterium]|nr:asparagine synthetase B [Bacteroidota bacterium]
MCRISGIISTRLNPNELRERVGIMCDVLKHGGPDDEGFFLDERVNLAFGNRRLSIIDLSSNGHQPMCDDQQHAWITFNGEIYNYRELREQLLKAGAKFHSDTDTEV